MRAFTNLYSALDETTKTNAKRAAMVEYFASAPPEDAAWAVMFLSGGRFKRLIKSRQLRQWCAEAAQVPEWLLDESYDVVGDIAETAALLLPNHGESTELPLHNWVENVLMALMGQDERTQELAIKEAWAVMDERQRFVWNKLITGEFRVGVSRQMVMNALAQVAGVTPAVIAHRLVGHWSPTADSFARLISQEDDILDAKKPYPFYLAYPLELELEKLGPREDWQVEWKWDGIRAQLIRREGQSYLWSRGEDLITERFPEIIEMSKEIPTGTVLDGEVLAWKEGVLPFAKLQRRIGRKTLSAKLLAEIPVAFMAYDILEREGADWREQSLGERRAVLEGVVRHVNDPHLIISPLLPMAGWTELEEIRRESRERGVEGFMIKRLAAPYGTGRTKGDWWKWKIEPYSVDAVLMYAQRGHGRRASLYTDYTFGVWKDGELIPFAKAYSGLTDAEIRDVDAFVRRNTVEKFGPVRHVKPELVFELGFEGIQESSRHRSGVAVRFPRMLNWRRDKKADEADTIETVKALLYAKPLQD